ncbi:MAG: hypothetical protein ACRDYX_07130 [Egibacteraceae bacterium]
MRRSILIVALTACALASPSLAHSEEEINTYAFVEGPNLNDASVQDHSVVIVKGSTNASALNELRQAHPQLRFVNYEQAFALNPTEAAYARERGWLAITCDGGEIRPKNIPQVTLMDGTIPQARDWRTQLVGDETNTNGYDGSYLDTLGAYFNQDFYTGRPCGLTDQQWRDASIATVDLVQAKTGRFVIENGFGLGSSRAYEQHKVGSDMLIAAGDAVQVEQFLRVNGRKDADVALIVSINVQGKDVYAKCKTASETQCRSAFVRAGNVDRNYLSVSN